MRGSLSQFMSLAGIGLAVALTALPAPPLAAAEYFVAGKSLASQLLVNRGQRRVLKIDDKRDRTCAQRRFLNASVIRQPSLVKNRRAITERKWLERWILDRCGVQVDYYVFFTDLGDGGAYFSVVAPADRDRELKTAGDVSTGTVTLSPSD